MQEVVFMGHGVVSGKNVTQRRTLLFNRIFVGVPWRWLFKREWRSRKLWLL